LVSNDKIRYFFWVYYSKCCELQKGNKDSGVGKGNNYEMSKNFSRFKTYDYVTIKVNIDDIWVEQVDQVLKILQVYKYELKEN